MAQGNTDKKERNDIYTAFAVLGLFLFFGFLVLRSSDASDELQNVWVEQPATPDDFQGYPYPHDDESIEHMPRIEEVEPLPTRALMPVSTGTKTVTTTLAANINTRVPVAEEVAPTQVRQPITAIEEKIEIETKPLIAAVAPSVEMEKKIDLKVPVAIAKVKELIKPKSAPKPVVKAKPTPPARVVKPKVAKTSSGMKYITNKLPCVWVVGIFKNADNIDRVVDRLRLNNYEVATGAHEKGNYVGVPCACEKNDSKQTELRKIFSAQPWMLKK